MPIRITGMGSGLDIDKLVTDLMKAERMPLDTLKQKKTKITWASDLYREINTKMSTLKNALDKIKLTADWKDYKATSSNEYAVTATSAAGVPVGSHSVEVKQLAKGATITGNALASSFDPKTPLGVEGTLTIAGVETPIAYSANDTLTDIMNRVNSSSSGVKMAYDELKKQISVVTKETGSAVTLSISDSKTTDTGPVPGDLFAKIGITSTAATGQDAEVIIDGTTVKPSKNTFTANGITYTFKQENTTSTIQISGDNEGMVKQIKDFVEQYNSTIELLNQRVKEKKYRNFEPLTDDQKTDMKEADITNWESKAKSGLLGNDDILNTALRGMRDIINDTVSSLPSEYNALFKVGISTMPYNSNSPNDSGKLMIDEEALKKAISEDAGSVVGLFSNYPEGIANKLSKRVNDSMTQLVDKAGGAGTPSDSVTTTLGLRINDMNKKIETLNDRISSREEYYYKMFAAMDSAVASNNSQLNWLMQNMG
ncbi:flagellar hook-associated protein 2 [Paenibacillus sp. J53TS2]|uniref:flagellar filament capping protein FliD n=1 Tax=Paenibacillus sp. J53TS2 TaxID=2807197 RepID=UPI001B0D370C|nr:flagellar filament capping protein FliD [Paenibacillus sp. J53TS2]GIP47427.1 flagellar hook-associated protein 2 [Paenibacillus sp. J53TS2]